MADFNPVRHLRRWAADTPTAIAFHAPEMSMTYADAWTWTRQLAALMRDLGVRPGDVIAIDLSESLQLLFTHAAYHEAVISCARDDGFEADWLFTRTPGASGARKVVLVDNDFMARAQAQDLSGLEATSYSSKDSIARLVFSSGTTGTSKAVAYPVDRIEGRVPFVLNTWMRVQPAMGLLGLGTAVGISEMNAAMASGVPCYLAGLPSDFVTMLSRHRIAATIASPSHLVSVLDRLDRSGQNLPHLKEIWSVGTTLPSSVLERIRSRTDAKVINVYGSSEMGLATRNDDPGADPFDVGAVLDDVEMQIVDDEHRVLGPEEVGQIRFRAQHPTHEYFRDPEATARHYRDGFFYPGDRGSLSGGRLHLAGRVGELLNLGGLKVDPARIDEVALQQSGVVDAAAFAVCTRSGLAGLAVAVVAGDGFAADDFASTIASALNVPRPRVVFLDAIPRTDTGKAKRSELSASFD